MVDTKAKEKYYTEELALTLDGGTAHQGFTGNLSEEIWILKEEMNYSS